jgi:hypothetical protein
MRRYRIGFYPEGPHLGHSPISLAQRLADVLPGLEVDELSLAATELAQASFSLEREDDAAALNELFLALQQLGYSVAEATVSEWVDARVTGALLGAVGGGGAGTSGGDTWVGLAAAAIGLVAGAMIGSAICSERVLYRAEETTPGRWTLREVAEPLNPLLTPRLA